MSARRVTAPPRPLVKWTGGKRDELPWITPLVPRNARRHVEPFIGGGAVLMAVPPDLPALAADASTDLIGLWAAQRDLPPAFLSTVKAIDVAWTSLTEADRLCPSAASDAGRIRVLRDATGGLGALDGALPGRVVAQGEVALRRKRAFLARRGGEGPRDARLLASALRAGIYTALRAAHHASEPGPARAAMFWFLRDFCFGGMFRTGPGGRSNVPYGGMSYDMRGMSGRLAQLSDPAVRARLDATEFLSGDFEETLARGDLGEGDFLFLDPPYDSPFSTYDGRSFGRPDHLRLAALMAGTRASWLMVVGDTPFVRDAYASIPGVRVRSLRKSYRVGIKDRFDRGVTHLFLSNYDPEGGWPEGLSPIGAATEVAEEV